MDVIHLSLALFVFQLFAAIPVSQAHGHSLYEWKDYFYLMAGSPVAFVGQSRNIYNNYPERRSTIRVVTYSGNYLKLEVDSFHLGGNPWRTSLGSCAYGAETVSFGIGTGFNITWCGTLYAEELIFPTDSLTIRYKRGIGNIGPGFAFRISSVPRTEQVSFLEVTKEPRLIYSPMYPKQYEPNTDYRLPLHASPGDTINLRAVKMDVEKPHNHNDCRLDHITLEDLYSGEILRGPYCGKELFSTRLTFRRAVVFRFRSDGNVQGAGYEIVFWSESPESHELPGNDSSGEKGGSMVSTKFVFILVGATAAVLLVFLVILLLVKWRRSRKHRDRESRRLLTRDGARPRRGRRRRGGCENPVVYMIDPPISDDFEPPPPYPGIDIANGDERGQSDAPFEAPPRYEELNPQALPQVLVQQAIEPPRQEVHRLESEQT